MAAEIVVHGHFYQPPRENPWTGVIDEQPSAAPFHDWNERVHDECYRPNAFAQMRIEDEIRTVNNFERISFNVGPTLMTWLQDAHPDTYARIVEADAASVRDRGRGNALAQAYHHTILPLSTPRDVRTEILWGLADFAHRYGRRAEGMWLPECAANEDVLAVLIDCGVEFTLLAPWQAAGRWDGEHWVDTTAVPIDTELPYVFEHPDGSGRSLVVFFYDASIAHSIAFERAASSAENFLWLFARRDDRHGEIVHVATDGETYGHHHKFSEVGLAYALFELAPRHEIPVTNYASFLERHSPTRRVHITQGEGTSWSCMHGVGRWTRDCGCSTGGGPGFTQAWRTPLRDALNMLHGFACDAYGRLGEGLFSHPWGARDRYIHVLTGEADVYGFVSEEARRGLTADETQRAVTLLEMQRRSMSTFTSCAWFFNDLAGIETVQILRYAAHTMDLLEEAGVHAPREAFTALLEKAAGNDPEAGTGAQIFAAAARAQSHPPLTSGGRTMPGVEHLDVE